MSAQPIERFDADLPDFNQPLKGELSDLLEIISGTSALLENIWEGNEGSEKYVEMLRESVGRAEEFAAQLVARAGEADGTLFMPETVFQPIPPPVVERKHRILMADDEPTGLALTQGLLKEAGYQVVCAQSGFGCLDLFHRQPNEFDLVLLDVSMPFMDGEETFQRLRTIRPDIAVVLTTGFLDQKKLERLFDAGLAGFLRKPYSPKEFIDYIRSVIEGQTDRPHDDDSTSGASAPI